MDIEIGGKQTGTIVMELFKNVVPRTAENFRQLCTGEAGRSKVSGKMLQFQGSAFHRIIDGFMAQGGDFTRGNGTGGESIYGEKFADENFKIRHTEKYLLSSANAGRSTNGSQIFITFEKTPCLDGKHVVFGRVEKGKHVVEAMQAVQKDNSDKPKQLVKIKKCGAMKLKEDKAADEKKPEEESKEPVKPAEPLMSDKEKAMFKKHHDSKDIKKDKKKKNKHHKKEGGDKEQSSSSRVEIGLE